MYLAAGEKEYLLDTWRDAEAGDCVTLLGNASGDCDSSCATQDGCIHPVIFGLAGGCEITECGYLTRGLGECTYFESALVGKYLLNELGGFVLGDSIRISGTIHWCLSECLATSRCIEVRDITPCGAYPTVRTTWGRIRSIYR
jgi:hypothetical protein